MVTVEMDKGDKRRLTKALVQMEGLTRKPIHDILKQHGRLLAVDAVYYTDRKGKSKSIRDKQEKEIRTTIMSTYLRPTAVAKVISQRFGRQKGKDFANNIKNSNIAKAQATIDQMGLKIDGASIIVGRFDNGKLHKERLKGRYKTRMCVLGFAEVTAYLKSEIKKIGELKSGWARAAEMLGKRGTKEIPAFAKKKHHKTKGRGKVTGQKSKAVLEVSNFSPAMKYTPSLDGVWRTRINSIEKTIRDTIEKRSKRYSRKV